MHMSFPERGAVCVPGCVCADGYVEEEGQCVAATSCPCHHGGRSYAQSDIIKKDCNTWYSACFLKLFCTVVKNNHCNVYIYIYIIYYSDFCTEQLFSCGLDTAEIYISC